MPLKSKTSSMDFNEGECMQTGDASGLSQITDHLLLTLWESQWDTESREGQVQLACDGWHGDGIRHYDSWISLTTDALEIWNSLSSLCDTFLTGSLIMLRMRRSDTQRKGCGPLWLWPVLLSMWQLVSDPGRDLVTEGNGRGQRH